jgi:hypothetical protein
MKANSPVSASYWSPIRTSVCFQIPILLLGVLCLDGGELFSRCLVAFAAFWSGTILILFRRPRNASKLDLEVIRFGYPLLFLLSLFLVPAEIDFFGL